MALSQEILNWQKPSLRKARHQIYWKNIKSTVLNVLKKETMDEELKEIRKAINEQKENINRERNLKTEKKKRNLGIP